ncbi:MFS transporter [Tabrizicola sp. WMC-M-20]|nr:MFS transporter [Tabrizicola sp. WMC-M-20]
MTAETDSVPAGRFAAFGNRGYRYFWAATVLNGFAIQIQTVAVGWYIYDLTRNPLDLGLVGLSQFLPALLLVLVTGSVADRFPRRTILAMCLLAEAVTAGLLLAITLIGFGSPLPIFAAISLFGVARAFYNPARQSIVPNLVPRSQLANAIGANTTANQFAIICGPVAGGLLYAIGPQVAYASTITFVLIAFTLVMVGVPVLRQSAPRAPDSWETLSAGFRFIWNSKPVLAAISLDLVAVLMGGALALLPVYARDILQVGPEGLGLLRAGPAFGAIVIGVLFMWHPIGKHAGIYMFLAVAGFGVATFVFALSETLWLSFATLVLIGGFDMVSVNIRSVLVQLWTPDDVRGRVTAVNAVFIGASNEIGAFRAGLMAVWIGPVAAVAVGGTAILGIAATWAWMFPQLRNVRSLR